MLIESRLNRREIEWTPNQELFDAEINRLLVQPDIDLFASRLNYRLKPYVSFKPDPGVLAVDAFSVQWSQYFLLCFSSLQHYNEDPPKDPPRPGNWTSGRSFLAHPSLVASTHEDVNKRTPGNTQQKVQIVHQNSRNVLNNVVTFNGNY